MLSIVGLPISSDIPDGVKYGCVSTIECDDAEVTEGDSSSAEFRPRRTVKE